MCQRCEPNLGVMGRRCGLLTRQRSCCRDGDFAALDSLRKLWHARAKHLFGARNRSCADVQQFRGCANWRTHSVLVRTNLQIRNASRDHGPLALVQVTAVEIATDSEAKRIRPIVDFEARLDAGDFASEITATTVEYFAFIEHYSIEKAVVLDVPNKLVQAIVIEHRKNFGELVERNWLGWHGKAIDILVDQAAENSGRLANFFPRGRTLRHLAQRRHQTWNFSDAGGGPDFKQQRGFRRFHRFLPRNSSLRDGHQRRHGVHWGVA